MCADSYCDVYNEIGRKARKEHECCACHETIRKGERYVVISSLFDGKWATDKQCLRCNTMLIGIAIHTGEPVVVTLDCGADPFEPGQVPELEYLAFATREEMQGAA